MNAIPLFEEAGIPYAIVPDEHVVADPHRAKHIFMAEVGHTATRHALFGIALLIGVPIFGAFAWLVVFGGPDPILGNLNVYFFILTVILGPILLFVFLGQAAKTWRLGGKRPSLSTPNDTVRTFLEAASVRLWERAYNCLTDTGQRAGKIDLPQLDELHDRMPDIHIDSLESFRKFWSGLQFVFEADWNAMYQEQIDERTVKVSVPMQAKWNVSGFLSNRLETRRFKGIFLTVKRSDFWFLCNGFLWPYAGQLVKRAPGKAAQTPAVDHGIGTAQLSYVCSECGQPVQEDDRFCGACGARLDDDTRRVVTHDHPPTTQAQPSLARSQLEAVERAVVDDDLAETVQEQVDRLINLGFPAVLDLSPTDYKASIPPVPKPPPGRHGEQFPHLTLVEPRLTVAAIIHLVHIKDTLSNQGGKWLLYTEAKSAPRYFDSPYWLWGGRRQVKPAMPSTPPGSRWLTATEGIFYALHHRNVFIRSNGIVFLASKFVDGVGKQRTVMLAPNMQSVLLTGGLGLDAAVHSKDRADPGKGLELTATPGYYRSVTAICCAWPYDFEWSTIPEPEPRKWWQGQQP